jgi:hypothetical protein
MGSALESENLSNPNLGKPTSSSQEIAILGLKLPYFKRASSKLGLSGEYDGQEPN